MLPTHTHAHALGRLIADLESAAGNDVLGVSLAAIVHEVRSRTVTLELRDDALYADETLVDTAATPDAAALVAACRRHGVTRMAFTMGATPRELLQFAALLAVRDADPAQPSVVEAARRLGFWHLTVRGDDQTRAAANITPPAPPAAVELGDLDDAHWLATELVVTLDRAVEQGDAVQVATVLSRAIRTERAAMDAANRTGSADAHALLACWTDIVEHLTTQPAIKLVVGLLTTMDFSREELVRILRRAGPSATSTLMVHLSATPFAMDRRILFDAIVEVGTGWSVLVTHLDHKRWFVVRNAACLLGAMRAEDAEPALIARLTHKDERVRTAIATALLQLGSANGRRALERIIRDTSSAVRRQALRGLLTSEGLARSAAVLSEALDLERDTDVQMDVVSGLRELGTPHAVHQLVRLCSPASSAGRGVHVRRAALEALLELRPTVAMSFLRIEAQDRDATVSGYARAMLQKIGQAA
jgi:hypothetical protein